MLSDFGIDTIFTYIGWQNLFHLKKLTYLKLIIMLFCKYVNQLEPKIVSHLQNKHIEFDCDTLGNILSNKIIGDFMYEV
jgi:hypothetical protein